METGQLIQRYLLGIATDDDVRELEGQLESSEDLRREFVRAAQIDVVGREVAVEQSLRDSGPGLSPDLAQRQSIGRTRSSIYGWWLAAAASLLLVVALWPESDTQIATIVSSENAAWESSLPTRPGDPLSAGILSLKAGVATIRFDKGAELLLEAPAKLELISDMRCRLDSGAAIVEVPDASVGFVVESPGGFAEDFGTRFAIRVDESAKRSDFELIEGEIEVHHDRSGDSVRLKEQGLVVAVSDESIHRVEEIDEIEAESVDAKRRVAVIGTRGRCGTAMPRFSKRWKFINPAVLSVKRSDSGEWDYRSFFSFDLSGVDLDQVAQARLRLNLVPSVRGLISRLPKVNRFGVYGLTNEAKSDWEIDSRWEEAPGPEDGELLGAFEIERSQTRGVFGIQGDELLRFLKNHPARPITFVLTRETTQIEGVGPGLTHTFASDSHPESVGPQLELIFK